VVSVLLARQELSGAGRAAESPSFIPLIFTLCRNWARLPSVYEQPPEPFLLRIVQQLLISTSALAKKTVPQERAIF
jgi:hypothetical protein